VEAGFQQVPGDTLSFKEQIGRPVAAVNDLGCADRTDGKLNPVASHGKKNCTASTGARSCRRTGDIPFCRFTGESYLANGQKTGFQICPLHSSSASSYLV
jgi:hypothetical protein